MTAIMLHEHTLGLVRPEGLEVLHTSVLRGSPYSPAAGVVAFDPARLAGKFRIATEKDFADFRVKSHPEYFSAEQAEGTE